ncbi:hypothetical protein AAFC00_006607 [Neodothiora populina]|uniref:Uncharacterized protein n=1 Tax=Neodothiora populina TaxID=2781224 RepID=A0ABR3PAQ4_9PEZI
MEIYGYDRGTPDSDLPRNNDYEALSSTDPKRIEQRVDSPALLTPPISDSWYYARPVPVCFPSDLTPLPALVLENKMNMVYFHYFINYTSKILVTHDCASNPFRTVLPKLAMKDENLLSLVLAYASCHRARLLHHAEPINRIASYVTHLFPRFREALASGQPVSETLFGTCVMLASLTQSYPWAFDAPISWPQHLGMARQMCQSVVSRKNRPRSKAMYFFLRWFGYLDTFASCSANHYRGSFEVWSPDLLEVENNASMGCLVGYTNRSLVLLARTADLAKACDQERKTTGNLSPKTVMESQLLRCTLELTTLEIPHQRYECTSVSVNASSEIFRAVNTSLCHAALIMLHRRVYALPSESPLVQSSVHGIMASLSQPDICQYLDIPDVILPLYLAGSESQNPGLRNETSRRLQRIGDAGMSQVARVRNLLHHIWESGQDWTAAEHEVLLG